MPIMPATSKQKEYQSVQLSPSDSFALHIAFEVVRKKGWLKHPERHLGKINKTVWNYRNKKIEYSFQFKTFNKLEQNYRLFDILVNLTEVSEGIDGFYEASSSSPKEKLKGDCSTVIEDNGNFSGICLITDRESIFD